MDSKPNRPYVVIAVRLLMGLGFLVFGLNGFFDFLPKPKDPMPEGAVAFLGALQNSGYMFKLIPGTEVVVGALLLTNCFVPLALALNAPLVVNIVAFHLFLEPSGNTIALVVLLLECFLAFAYRGAFRTMLALKTKPG